MVKPVVFEEFLFEKLSLLVKIVLLNISHELFDLALFIFNKIVQRDLHPHEHRIEIAIFLLNSDILLSVQEIVFLLELVPQLFTPLGEDSQNGWTLYHQVALTDLFRGVDRNTLGYFASDEIMSVIFHLRGIFLVYLDIVGLININSAWNLSIFDRLPSLAIHPLLIVYVFKQLRHGIEKLFIDSLVGICGFAVDLSHQPVQKSHDQIVVVSVLAIGENHFALLEEIIFLSFCFVDWLYSLIQGLIYISRLSHWILSFEISDNIFFNVLIEELYLILVQLMSLNQQDNVAEDSLRTANLRLLVAQLVFRQEIERTGYYLVANLGAPNFQNFITYLFSLLQFWQIHNHLTIPRFQLFARVAAVLSEYCIEGISNISVSKRVLFVEGIQRSHEVGFRSRPFLSLSLRVQLGQPIKAQKLGFHESNITEIQYKYNLQSSFCRKIIEQEALNWQLSLPFYIWPDEGDADCLVQSSKGHIFLSLPVKPGDCGCFPLAMSFHTSSWFDILDLNVMPPCLALGNLSTCLVLYS